MASDRKHKQSNSIPIRFFDGDDARSSADDPEFEEGGEDFDPGGDSEPAMADARASDSGFGGPRTWRNSLLRAQS